MFKPNAFLPFIRHFCLSSAALPIICVSTTFKCVNTPFKCLISLFKRVISPFKRVIFPLSRDITTVQFFLLNSSGSEQAFVFLSNRSNVSDFDTRSVGFNQRYRCESWAIGIVPASLRGKCRKNPLPYSMLNVFLCL